MAKQDILSCLVDIKEALQPKKRSTGGIVCMALDDESKDKYKVLQTFLPRLEEMEKTITKEIDDVAPLSKQLQQQMNTAYNARKIVQEKIDMFVKEINTQQLKINTCNIDINKHQGDIQSINGAIEDCVGQLNSKKNELKKAWIPFYGLAIIKTLQRIEQEDIPELERRINNYKNDITIKNEIITSYKKQIENCQKIIADINQKQEIEGKLVEKHNQEIQGIHQKIALQINNITYLSILKTRIQEYNTHGNADIKVMSLLDLEPEVIHYEDEVYFTLLDKWQESHDPRVFQDFVMKAEKDFFASI